MTRPIAPPIAGLSDAAPFGQHKPNTTTELSNFWTVDPRTGRVGQLSTPSGYTKVTSTVLAANTRVHTLMECIYANPLSIFTNATPVLVENAATGRSLQDILNGITDTDGNTYELDGLNGIVKRNHDLVFQYRIALPSLQLGDVVRSLATDSAGLIFAGVSAGNDPRRAKLWCFEEIEDNRTQLLWEITPGWFTEAIKVTEAGLYCAQNNSSTWQSRMALYVGFSEQNPTLLREWRVAYPVNDADVSAIDGTVATTHPPEPKRGFSPRSPETTAVLEDWSIFDLPHIAERGWTWLSSLSVDGADNTTLTDSTSQPLWADLFGNGRYALEGAAGKGFTHFKGTVAGRDSMFGNGTDQWMRGQDAVSTDFLYRQSNKSLFPAHVKHQFALFALLRVPQKPLATVAMSLNFGIVANAKDRQISVNASWNATTYDNASGGVQIYEDITTANGSSGRATVTAAHSVPCNGAFDAGGLVLITYVFDGGYDDVTVNPTRSCLRINGRPIDRWNSDTGYQTLRPATLLCNAYNNVPSGYTSADLLEFMVLSDWYDTVNGVTSSYTQQRLLEMPFYPDVIPAAGSKTECEKIESLLAGRHGALHILPSGHEANLLCRLVPALDDRTTIDGVVYVWKNAVGATANQVLIDASGATPEQIRANSLRNLHHAINGTGRRGTVYGTLTTPQAGVWSPGVSENSGGGLPTMYVQAREARGPAFTTDTQDGAAAANNARLDWIQNAGATNAATSVTSTPAFTGGNAQGVYPHPYFLYKTSVSGGGPPSSTANDSIFGSLASPYGLLCTWDASNGKLKNAITTSGSGTQTGGGSFLALPFGGIGYGVRFLPDGNMISAGPRQAAVTALATVADNTDIRKIVVTATGYTVTDAAGIASSWSANPGAWDYAYPRMAVDSFGNVYVPFSSAALAASMLIYREIGTSGAINNALMQQVDTLTSDPKGRAVAIDPNTPSFPNAYADKRAEIVYLFTERAATTLLAVHELRLVTVAANTGQPHTVTVRAAGCGTALHQVNDDGTHSVIDANAFDANASMVFWAHAFGRVFMSDGVGPAHVWDPAAGTFGFWRARTGGTIPKRILFLTEYRNRLFGVPADERNVVIGTKSGDPFDVNFAPKGDEAVPLAAFHSRLSETTGNFPDNATGLFAKENDILVAGAMRSIWVLRGDPMQGGQFDMIVKGVGIAYGRAACFTPDGVMFFISDQGELRRLMPEALASKALSTPPLVSGDIAVRLSSAIDFAVCRTELHYEPQNRRLHIRLFKNSAADTSLLKHFTYELDTGAFSERPFGTNAVQPASTLIVSGTADAKRTVWEGGHDGHVRFMDPTANSDDGVVIAQSVLIPLTPNDTDGREWEFRNFAIELTQDSGSRVLMEFVESDNPDALGYAVAIADGILGPGRNTPSTRISGNYVAMRIKSHPTTAQRISIIDMRADGAPCSTQARIRNQ